MNLETIFKPYHKVNMKIRCKEKNSYRRRATGCFSMLKEQYMQIKLKEEIVSLAETKCMLNERKI